MMFNANLIATVIDSLLSYEPDYCFTETDAKIIITAAKQQRISFIYKKVTDKYGELDYYVFIPCEFRVKINKKEKILHNNRMGFAVSDIPDAYTVHIYTGTAEDDEEPKRILFKQEFMEPNYKLMEGI